METATAQADAGALVPAAEVFAELRQRNAALAKQDYLRRKIQSNSCASERLMEKEVEMKIEISKEWCMRMAQHEGTAEIGAGQFALDPVFDGELLAAEARADESPNVAFGRLVNLMRRQREISLEQLAENADVDMADLVKIESDPHHRPELRTAYQLANYFKVSQAGLMQVVGLAGAKDSRLFDEGVRFAARSESTAELTPQEVAALEAFVAVLSEQQ